MIALLSSSVLVEQRVHADCSEEIAGASSPPLVHRVNWTAALFCPAFLLYDLIYPLERKATFNREIRTAFLSWLLLRHLMSLHFYERYIELVLRSPVSREVRVQEW